jgi:hypothetical protein
VKKVLNQSQCTDDYGNQVFFCQYTGKSVSIGEHIFIGPVVPQVNGTYVCAKNAMQAYKESKAMFNENEANCNTCAKLERLKHEKRKDGLLIGNCKNIGENIQFHPDNHMAMPCWVKR